MSTTWGHNYSLLQSYRSCYSISGKIVENDQNLARYQTELKNLKTCTRAWGTSSIVFWSQLLLLHSISLINLQNTEHLSTSSFSLRPSTFYSETMKVYPATLTLTMIIGSSHGQQQAVNNASLRQGGASSGILTGDAVIVADSAENRDVSLCIMFLPRWTSHRSNSALILQLCTCKDPGDGLQPQPGGSSWRGHAQWQQGTSCWRLHWMARIWIWLCLPSFRSNGLFEDWLRHRDRLAGQFRLPDDV